jgi:hypothetical protein
MFFISFIFSFLLFPAFCFCCFVAVALLVLVTLALFSYQYNINLAASKKKKSVTRFHGILIKLKKDFRCNNFVQTMYLVPRGKKCEKKVYCIMNDILRIINHNYQVIHHSKLVVSLKSQDIDPRFFFQIHASTR